jgi:thiosulfate dehydrogenase [quinone] large subunit
MKHYLVEEPRISHALFNTTAAAWFWLIVRIYVGWEWLSAGIDKLHNPEWIGGDAGTAISGFITGALAKTAGAHPDVQGWYAAFLKTAVISHPVFWSYLVTWGEIFVGIALIVGFLTGIAAFFGLFMNLNYLLAGTVSTNPVLFTLAVLLMLSWKVAGYVGIDRFVLPYLGHKIRRP